MSDDVYMTAAYRMGELNERRRITKLIEEEIERVSNPMLVDREYLDGLETAIEIIKGKTNDTKITLPTIPKVQVRCGVNGCGCSED